MYVYLKLGNKVKVVPGVSLKECFLPVIGETQLDFQMEPAIWFKTLLVDCMLIDCDSREVRWNRQPDVADSSTSHGSTEYPTSFSLSNKLNSDSEGKESRQSDTLSFETFSREVYENGECYDFDPLIDDVFDTAIMLMNKHVKKREHHQQDFNEEILRLLHCLILPALKLSRQDLTALDKAEAKINASLTAVDKDIIDKQKGMCLTQNSLLRQRERFLEKEKFCSELYVKTCNRDFLTYLLHHIEKDISVENDILFNLQTNVDELRDVEGQTSRKRLNSIREQRNLVLEHLEKIQTVRETIKNVVGRVHIRKKMKCKIKENLFHDVYLEISRRLKAEKEAVHSQCLKKVKISSVREAILIAMKELDTEQETVGVHVRVDGAQMVTDIFDPTQKPKEWFTLEEKIASVLVNSTSSAFKEHVMFSGMLSDKIQETLGEIKFFSQDWHNSLKLLDTMGNNSRARRAGGHRSNVRASETSLDQLTQHSMVSFQENLKQLSADIKEHIKKMCHLLIKSMPEYFHPKVHIGKNFFSKLWVCYESHLYNKLMEWIGKIYETVYATHSSNLGFRVSHLSLAELGINESLIFRLVDEVENSPSMDQRENTQVKKPVSSSDLFVENPDSNSDSLEENAPSPVEKLSLKQLYEIADQDCCSLETLSIPYVDSSDENESYSLQDISDVFLSDQTDMKEVEGFVSTTETSVEMRDSGDPAPSGTCSQTKMVSQKQCPPPPYSEVPSANMPPSYEESMCFGILFMKSLAPAVDHIQSAITAPYVMNKLKLITKAFRFIGNFISQKESELRCSMNPHMACCDEILTVIIVLLRCLSTSDFTKLYAHLNLMIDLMAPFMIGSVHDCSLTNFIGAYQYLFDRQLLQNRNNGQQSTHGADL